MELNGVFDNIIRKVKRTVTLIKNQQTKHDLELICNDWISVANYPRTKVSLCGKFNAGKSALINALFNKKIVISKPISSTGVITKIYYSERPEYFVIKLTGKGEVKQSFSPEQIKYLTVKDNFNNSENVRDIIRVEIGYPLMQLQEGLEIYDTPGLEDIDPKMNEITFSHIDETDFIIFVIDAMQLKDLKELLLRYYNYLGKNVIFVAKLYQGKSEKPLYAGKSEVIKIKATDNKVHLVLTRENADLDIDILIGNKEKSNVIKLIEDIRL